MKCKNNFCKNCNRFFNTTGTANKAYGSPACIRNSIETVISTTPINLLRVVPIYLTVESISPPGIAENY